MGRKAFDSWKLLSGIICVYKPPQVSYRYTMYKLKNNICKDLNNLETRPQRKCLIADRSGSEISIKIRPSYADSILCSGPRYQNRTVHLITIKPLSNLASGVLLLGINADLVSSQLQKLSFTKCYHIKGVLGKVTSDYLVDGKVLAKAKYNKVKRSTFEGILSSFQSSLQMRVFEEYGVPLHTQEAYNFAVKGFYRPVWKGPTIIYSLKVIDFQPPNFTIEVQCINETETYLTNLIHNLGLRLKCYAACAGIRCLRHGCFHIDHALSISQWNLDDIIENIKLTWEVLENNYPNKLKFLPTVNTVKKSLTE